MAIVLNGNTGIQNVLGSASAPAESNTTSSNTGLYFPTSTTLGLATNGTAALTIDASQNVGIGTSSPTSALDIYSTSSIAATLTSNAGTAVNQYVYVDASGGTINRFYKSRGTLASPTAVNSGDLVGRLNFLAYGGSNFRSVLVIDAGVQTYTSDTNISGYTTFGLNLGSTGTTELFRLGVNGVGIQMAGVVPSNSLSFGGNNNRTIAIERNNQNNNGTQLTVQAGGAASGSTDKNAGNLLLSTGISTGAGSGFIYFQTTPAGTSGTADNSPVERMRIDSSGNVGIGTTSTSGCKLNIGGTAGTGLLSMQSFGTTTNYNYQTIGNSSGSYTWGVESSTGGSVFTGTAAYSGFAGTGAATSYHLITNSAVRATIDSSGNVGIGTSSPSQKLHVSSTSDNAILSSGGSGAAGYLVANGNGRSGLTGALKLISYSAGIAEINNASNAAMLFSTNDTERARIDSSGNLLVGKTSSSNANIGFEARPAGGVFATCSDSTSGTTTYHVYSTGAGAYRFYVGLQGQVYATNTTIAAISDQRLKENIQDLDVGLDAIMALKPRKFDWKTGKGKDKKGDRGWIAQEFEQVFPEMIGTWLDEPPEGEEPYKSVSADLIPVLVKAMQEQQAQITSLKAELDALKGTK